MGWGMGSSLSSFPHIGWPWGKGEGVIRCEVVFKYVWSQSFDEVTYGPKLDPGEFLSNTLIM